MKVEKNVFGDLSLFIYFCNQKNLTEELESEEVFHGTDSEHQRVWWNVSVQCLHSKAAGQAVQGPGYSRHKLSVSRAVVDVVSSCGSISSWD